MTTAPLGEKIFATLQAKAALLGVSLIRSEDERGHEVFIVSKCATTRELSNSTDVERLLERMEGQAA